MGKNANELAMRDPALAALMGVGGADFGNDLGYEPELLVGAADFGGNYGGGYSGGPDFGDDAYDMGFADIGADFGVDFGVDFGADPTATAAVAAPPLPPGTHPAVRAIVAKHVQQTQHRNSRALLLEPNKYSDLKVERYTFAINATITALGTSGALGGSNSPDVNFRPQRVTSNVVSPGMVTISDARVANVSFTVGGNIDAWQWNANAVGEHLDVPTLTPANKATFSGTYTGLVPSPLSGTGTYPFALSFTGPASIVA